ncbi:MAG TPA: hypothetical protein VLA37_11950, partial [Sphingomonadaceae bacterium]|nr:hypothetical protein [Sphingomonadaceae bacterium]
MEIRLTQRNFLKGLLALLAAPFAKKAIAQPASNPNQAKHEELVARTLAALPYERISVPGKDAYQHWQRLKGEGRGWPVVIGDNEDLNRIAEQFSIDDLELFG